MCTLIFSLDKPPVILCTLCSYSQRDVIYKTQGVNTVIFCFVQLAVFVMSLVIFSQLQFVTKRAILTTIFPGEPRLAICPNLPFPFIPRLWILLGLAQTLLYVVRQSLPRLKVTTLHIFFHQSLSSSNKTIGCYCHIQHGIIMPPGAQGALSDDAVWCLTSAWGLTSVAYIRAACAAGRLDGAYWLIGPGSAGLAQGCRCALPLQAWAWAYRGARPPTA